MSTIGDCRVIQFPWVTRPEGKLTAVHGNKEIPFDIQRIYYPYDLPAGESRGAHAHRVLEQLLVCIMGSIDVTLDDGRDKKTITLDRAHKGLLLPRMIWRELGNFSSGAVCLVLASLPYDEVDYIRDYNQFLQIRSKL